MKRRYLNSEPAHEAMDVSSKVEKNAAPVRDAKQWNTNVFWLSCIEANRGPSRKRFSRASLTNRGSVVLEFLYRKIAPRWYPHPSSLPLVRRPY